MGKIDYFSIILTKEVPIYFSGEPLKGFMNFRIRERFKINSVKMHILGGARVHWTEQHGSGKNKRTVSYSAYEKYLEFDMFFLNKSQNSDLYLEPGDYSYPFEFYLPQNIPTSFEHAIGRVRYSLNGTIDIPWAFDKHTKRSFSVVSHLDLNKNPNLRQSFGVTGEKVLCCCLCKSEPITAEFSILKAGYVPGEAIVFNIAINNRSNREIKEMTVNLIQKIRFHSTTKTRTCTRNVANIRFPQKIAPRSIDRWDNSVLVIPPICSTSNGFCRIIEVSYLVIFNFDASGLAISKNLVVPIIIGTIPLTPQAQMIQPQIPYTYEACIFGPNPVNMPAENDDKTKGEIIDDDANTFRPLYPYYKDFSTINCS